MLTVYRSSAGAGKTFTLVKRYIGMLFAESGRNVHRKILAVTFTKKATAEMKERIIGELHSLARGSKSAYADGLKQQFRLSDEQLQKRAAQLLNDILQDYSSFAVSTIDSFFQQIIRSFARELNLPGAYNIELDSNVIQHSAVDNYFLELPKTEQSREIKALVRIVEENIDEGHKWDPRENIFNLSGELLKEAYQQTETELYKHFEDPEWLPRFVNTLRSLQNNYIAKVRSLEKEYEKALMGFDEGEFSRGNQCFAPFHYSREQIAAKVPDKISSYFCKFVADYTSAVKKKAPDYVFEAALRVHPVSVKLHEHLTGEEARIYVTCGIVLKYLPYLEVLYGVAYQIGKANQELNRLPIAQTNRLLNTVVSKQEENPFVYDKTGTRINHYMIDEFQDTSSMQWSNFLPLLLETLSRGESNMLVGDSKQSIYRWRNSQLSLLQNINNDFKQLELSSLPSNWRSDKTIVEQNNYIFSKMAEREEQMLSEEVSVDELDYSITAVYQDVEQLAEKLSEEGYVNIRFWESDDKDDRNKLTIDSVLDIVRDIAERGISLGKVAILIRMNYEAVAIAEALLGAGYQVMSAAALYLANSPEVRYVIARMKSALTPDDKILTMEVSYLWQMLNDKNGDTQDLPTVDTLSQLPLDKPLTRLIESIISEIPSDRRLSGEVYIDALRDLVCQYITRFNSDIYSFISWWDESGCDSKLNMQPTADTIQITTIHKSKGLEYDIVIVPYLSWDTAKPKDKSKQNILWVKPTVAPFNMLPVLPVRFGPDLQKSLFSSDYSRELRDLFIDNLNLLYVAFTRAKRELYAFSARCDYGKNIELKEIGEVLHSVLNDELDENGCYIRGEKIAAQPFPRTAEPPAFATPSSWVVPLLSDNDKKLTLRLASHDFFARESENGLKSAVNLGRVMHELLCRIITKSDEQKAIAELFQTGQLTAQEKAIVRKEMEMFWQLVEQTDWFEPQWQVMNEQTIILPEGVTRRPDRLMLQGDEAVIVDYKFGHILKPEYKTQVAEYMLLMSQMGYRVKGYLCYVNLKQIIPVML